IAGQRGLRDEAWPDGVELKVRMGIATGEFDATAADLVGIRINRAARIAAVAHGGQILCDESTVQVGAELLPPSVRLGDLVEVRLKDLLAATHIFQIEVDDLPGAFPPLRTPDAHPNNLPTQLTTFVGRDA